jgi:hypothetical protein
MHYFVDDVLIDMPIGTGVVLTANILHTREEKRLRTSPQDF